ncbi:MAG TPA: XdhC family protein [Methylomirabilota bacterium]|jgi:xanthine dehydrogenase accessory factor|nr:XdhC family protein [Methylomirabilota bacterium]
MSVDQDWLARAHELAQRGEPFALATVVRCERPTSAKPGARALIRADGRVSGWIGGSCAEPTVVREALAALREGQPRLVALVGDGAVVERREGVRELPMTCHSGGTLEIYIEPVLPKPQLVLIGAGPVVETLARLATAVSFGVVAVEHAEDLGRLVVPPRAFVVVATHGRFDEDALEWALGSAAPYVSLVASPKRAKAVIEVLVGRGVAAERLGRLKAPAGLDLGAVTPEEIAVSILAEIVLVSRREPASAASAEASAESMATDPVCGMAVEIASARHTTDLAGRPVYFCGAGCQRTFDRDPTAFSIPARP